MRIRSIVLTVIAMAACSAPVLAETVQCTVSAPSIRVRKSPSKKSHVVAVLKKDSRITAADKCSGGWVKVRSEDGRVSGYVGGWALSESADKVAVTAAEAAKPEAAKPETPKTETPKTETAKPAVALKEIPTNEQLAIQITDLRLHVLGMDRNMKKMSRDIKKIKVAMARSAAAAKTAAAK